MLCQFDVLSIPTADTPSEPVILLSYDNQKYLFNCGEGSQRAALAYKTTFGRIADVFLTSGWGSHGGLAGLLLSITSGRSRAPLRLHGPKNLAYYLATLRAGQKRDYRYSGTVDLKINEYDSEFPSEFRDSNVVIQPILSLPKSYNARETATSEADKSRVLSIAYGVWSSLFYEEKQDGSWAPLVAKEVPTKERMLSRKRSFSKVDQKPETSFRPTPDQYRANQRFMVAPLPKTFEPYPAAVSYFIQGRPRLGKFHPERAIALGVPPGPLFGRLQQGCNVTGSKGVVYPSQVMSEQRISPAILLITCPTIEYVDAVCDNPFWSTLTDHKKPVLIMHSCGSEVLRNARYIQFMASFGSMVKHLYTRSDQTQPNITQHKSFSHLDALQSISKEIYPLPSVSHDIPEVTPEVLSQNNISASPMQAGSRFSPIPFLSMGKVAPTMTVVESERHQTALDEFTVACKTVAKHITELEPQRPAFNHPGADVEILTLGTGSAGPSSYRNVAGTMILNPGDFYTLLDCGEGTVGQIRRAFGDSVGSAMQALRFVFISHMHADHHLGLIGLIKFWLRHNSITKQILYIICPSKSSGAIHEYDRIDDLQLDRVVFIASEELTKSRLENKSTAAMACLNKLHAMKQDLPGLKSVQTSIAVHSELAMCVRIDHKDGWSVSFSGDTRPNSPFVALSEGVTCMIHEATFEDDKLDEAVKKKHSTVSEALRIAQDSRAVTTILTHFSQRYPKIPNLTLSQTQSLSDRQIGLAVDLMRVKVKDIWKLGHHYQPQRDLLHKLLKLEIKEESDTEQVPLDDV